MPPSMSCKPSATWMTPRTTPRSSSSGLNQPATMCAGRKGSQFKNRMKQTTPGQHETDLGRGSEGGEDGNRCEPYGVTMVGKCEWGESERQSRRLSAIKRVGYVVLLPGPDGGR